ncbi:MAG: hypothetical protein ACFFAO_03775 [Candidatus Hermodarchaeota archaeon]
MSKEKIFKISSILAFLFALIGAILMLFTPWSYWWYSYVSGGFRYSGAGAVTVGTPGAGAFILLAAIFLLICAIVSLLAFIPGKITSKTPIIISLIFSIMVLVMIVIGVVVTVAIMAADNLYWEFGAGFYGGISSALLTIVCTLIMIFTWEK